MVEEDIKPLSEDELEETIELIEKDIEKRKKKSNSELYDLIKVYLREVSKRSLLTLEEEVEVTWKVWNGREALNELAKRLNLGPELIKKIIREKVFDNSVYWLFHREEIKKFGEEEVEQAREALNPKNLTKEEKRLLNIAIDGEFARKKLIEGNVRLVISNAKTFRNRGMDLIDMIQEGNLGLMKAIEKFEPHRGLKFSTYATWWIRQAVNRGIAEQARTIRIPVHMVETLNRMSRVVIELKRKLNRNPNVKEIAKAMGEGWTTQKVEEVLKLIAPPSSLEEPVKENNGNKEITVGDLIEDERVPHPESRTENKEVRRVIMEALNELRQEERFVLLARHGFLDGIKHTLEEIGVMLGVTRERARQIEGKATRSLKAYNARTGKLSSLL